MATNLLIQKGAIFLSASLPTTFASTSNNVWISEPTAVVATALPGKVQLECKKANLVFFASGLRIGENAPTDPLRFTCLDANSFEALGRCPKTPIRSMADGRLQFEGSESDLKNLKDCDFLDLSLPATSSLLEARVWTDLERNWNANSKRQTLSFYWRNGKRELQFPQRMDSLHIAAFRNLAKELFPFYKIHNSDGTAQPGRTLQFHLTLFEVSRSRALQAGLNWPKNLEVGRWIEDGFLKGYPTWDFAERKGIGRILAQPMLRTLPGEKVIFQSGGEIPIEMKSEKEFSTVFKNYGLQIEITPAASSLPGEGEVSIELKIELSEPELGMSAGKIPPLSKRLLSSRFDLRIDETTVLGSLFQSRKSAQRNGAPALLEIPLLRWLFSSADRNSSDSELWFGIRPTWIETPSFSTKDEDHEIFFEGF